MVSNPRVVLSAAVCALALGGACGEAPEEPDDADTWTRLDARPALEIIDIEPGAASMRRLTRAAALGEGAVVAARTGRGGHLLGQRSDLRGRSGAPGSPRRGSAR